MDVITALYLVAILIFIDNLMTCVRLSLYRKYRPDDDEWYDREVNSIGRFIFKRYGTGTKGLILNIVHSYACFGLFFYILKVMNFDIEFFAYAAFGAFIMLDVSHFHNYRYLKKLIKEEEMEKKR